MALALLLLLQDDPQVLTGHKTWVRCVAWSPDGTIASGGNDSTIRFWEGGREVHCISVGS